MEKTNTATIWIGPITIEKLDVIKLINNGFLNLFYNDFTLNYNFFENKKIIASFDLNKCNFLEVKKELLKNNLLYTFYYSKNKINFILNIEEQFIDDFNKILVGQYSKLSNIYRYVLKPINNVDRYETLRDIINKTPDGKEFCLNHFNLGYDCDIQEYWSIPNNQDFILN